MLCCLSRDTNPALDEQATRVLALIADLISDHLDSPATRERRDAHRSAAAIQSLLDADSVRMVFQPVVGLRDAEPLAFEALARFDDPAFPTPAHAFAAAARAGLGVELMPLAVRQALTQLDDVPEVPGWA